MENRIQGSPETATVNSSSPVGVGNGYKSQVSRNGLKMPNVEINVRKLKPSDLEISLSKEHLLQKSHKMLNFLIRFKL